MLVQPRIKKIEPLLRWLWPVPNLSIKMYSAKKTGVSYVPPSKRQADPLAAENFPSLCSEKTVVRERTTLNFLQKIKDGEEEQRLKESAAIYDPTRLQSMTVEQLEWNGWAVLSLSHDSIMKTVHAIQEMRPEDWIEEEDE